MTALTNDNISDIKKNLSDRYKSDFPIIKELIQNADDAKAPRFVFGIHSGIPDCKHPLLQGVGLWCFNDGEFKTADKESIGSMGINAKAGESEPIGKFGLGMKSVFHWCESFLYIAFDKEKSINCSDLINPWNNHKDNYPHKNWEDDWVNYESEDIRILKNEFSGLINKESSWFLLWIPLRTECHLKIPNRTDKKYSSITPNRPGDKLEELNFLTNENLSIQIGKLLPLLANIKEVSFLVNMENWKKYEFTIHLDIKPRLIKPDGEDSVTSIGKIKIGTIVEMPIWGKRNRINQCGTLFDKLKNHQYWPEIRYIDEEYGEEKTKEDKSSAEGAILISHQDGVSGKLTMQWAVFLPLEEKTHIKEVKIPNSSRHYHFVLHGQFFIDAGRLGIHSFDSLSKLCINIDDVKDEQSLRQVWNQALAQEMCFPLILPALNEYIKANQLKNNEIEELTIAFKQALEGFEYLKFICNEYSWFRELLPSGSQWRLHKNSDAINILPLPAPPQDSTKRPWEVLPCLAELQNTLFVDKDSAALSKNHYQWSEESILAILRNPAAHLFAEAAQLDYFDDFLKIISPQLGSGNVKQALLKFIREAISHHGQQRLRKNKTKIARVLEHIPAEKRWRFGAFEEKSQSNISDDILKALWQCESEILPIPAFLDSNDKSAQGKPTKQVAEQWLKSLHRFDSNSTLNLIKTILQSLEPNDRLSLIKSNADWKIVSAYDVKRDSDRAVSYQELLNANKESLLFLFAGMNKHEGIQLLQKCLSNQVILAIRSDDHKLLFDGEQLPKEDENEAILTALIKSKTALISDIKIRKELLKKCHYIKENNKDAKQGLRYLLHANFDQKDNANDSLWIKAHDQSSAWEKLQRKLIGNNHWQVIDSELSDVLPRDTWDTIGIKEIKPDEIIEELKEKQDIALLKAEDFSSDERNEILNKIDDENLWCLLPWHKTIGGHWVSIEANTYLKTSVELPDSLKKDISIIEPVSEITEKQKWIAKLDETVTISIALNSAEPSEYQEEILGWLGETNPKSDLQEKLKSTKWLLLKNNQAISPNDIIAITGLEDVIQKLAASADYAYASDKDLHDSIIQHSAFDQKVKPLFATKSESVLGTLALLMNEVSAYEIGSLDESDDISKLAKTLADCEFAPSWGVIKALLDAKTSNEDQKAKFTLDDCKNHLLPNLNRLPEKKALIKIFDWLQKKNTQQAQAAYAFYLRQMVVASYVEELLPQIKLLAKDDKSWRLASELCIDAPGVDDSFVLCDEQRSILKSHLKFGSEPVDKETNDSTQPTQLDNYLELFEGLSKNQLLGLLLILIGKAKEKQEQIKAYLNPFHIDQIFNSLRWNPPILNSLSILNYDLKITRSFEAENNKSCESALVNGLHIKLEQQQKNSKFAETNNLLGNKVTFKLRENIDNLFIDKSKLFVDKKEQKVSAILYLWDNKSISLNNSEHANEIIRKTCRWLWTELYLQDENSLNQVFDQLSESHQLDIDVTRRVILKHIVPYLDESLSANNEPPLKEYLSEAKDIEFRLAMNEKDNNQEDKEKLEKELKSNQEKLILSLKKPNIHNYVLRKLREKLSDYQYEKSGIPFELFQNADDALIEMKRYLPEEGFDNQIKQFNIKLEGNVLYLSHWGRPINYRGTSEVQKKWPHFAYDLKKMLTLSASGKSDDTGVTGRFGLGFKSVFLAAIPADLKMTV